MKKLQGLTLLIGGALLLLQGCDPEVVVYEKQTPKRDLGLPCLIDTECSTGRCQAGVCGINECDSDQDCRADEICNPISHTCESVDSYACEPGQSPLLQLDQTAVDFGTVTVGEQVNDTVMVNNIGDCLLTLEQAQLDSSRSDAQITCDNCAADDYPKVVPPGHSIAINLNFAPESERIYSGVLQLRTDDQSLTNGLVEVEISGDGLGHARMSIDPALIDFGNVLPNDPAATATITVTNVGAGTLEIRRVFIDPPLTSQMSVAPVVGATDSPIALIANESKDFTVIYDPSSLAASQAVIYFFSNDMTRACAADPNNTAGVGCVELSGDSRGPPAIAVSHDQIDFGQLNLGQSAAEMIVISNNGQSDLDLQVSMTALSSTDFRFTPPSTSVILSGGTAVLNVFYEAAQLNSVTGTLQIQSNDPSTPLKNVGLLGFGMSPYNNDVFKVEMTFENGDNGFFGNDFRDVNLYMESPYGEIVDKASCPPASPSCPDWTHGGSNDQANFGHPVWSAIGVQEEPERIILFDAHEDALGSFKACVYYREDCASIPTDLLAGLLGIGISALLTGLTEGLISPDSQDVAEFIRNNCWDHSSSRALISTFVNGSQVAQQSVSLRRTGDYSCPVDIQRINGLYCVSGDPSPPAGCP